MIFRSAEEAALFRQSNQELLNAMVQEALTLEGICFAEVWLNGASPSFVAGYDVDDQLIVTFPLQLRREFSV